MMDNMNFVLRQYPDDRFFGQLSNGHVTQSAWKDGNYIANYSRFGMLLNGEGSHVQGEVCSMLTSIPSAAAAACWAMMPRTTITT